LKSGNAFDALFAIANGRSKESTNVELRHLADSTVGSIISSKLSGMRMFRQFKQPQTPATLKQLLKSQSPWDREAALDNYPPDDRSVLPILVEMIRTDPSIDVVERAVEHFNALTKQSFQFFQTQELLEWWRETNHFNELNHADVLSAARKKFCCWTTFASHEFGMACLDRRSDFGVRDFTLVLHVIWREFWANRDHAARYAKLDPIPDLDAGLPPDAPRHGDLGFGFEGEGHGNCRKALFRIRDGGIHVGVAIPIYRCLLI
jgi:hypothetical protein